MFSDVYAREELTAADVIIPKLSNPEGEKGDINNPQTVAGTEKQVASISNDGEAKGSKFCILKMKKDNRHKVVDHKMDFEKPPYLVKDKGGFLMPTVLLT